MGMTEHLFEDRPEIVCLCGSTKFKDTFVRVGMEQTLAGCIVLTIGCDLRTDDELFRGMSEAKLRATKAQLDVLHFAKIDLADRVLVLNVGGYIGESTEREIFYAGMRGKVIDYLESLE